jgi:hypothetical protein
MCPLQQACATHNNPRFSSHMQSFAACCVHLWFDGASHIGRALPLLCVLHSQAAPSWKLLSW